jgi:hypothetical protein
MRTRSLARLAVVAAAAAGLAVAAGTGTASAVTYTCSNGHLYADGVHVPGDTAGGSNWTTTCNGNRVRTVIRVS